MLWLIPAAPVLLLVCWLCYINFPRGDYPATAFAPPQPPGSAASDAEPTQANGDKPQRPDLPFEAGVVYSPGYLINLGGLERLHPFDIRKYQRIHNALLQDGVLTAELTRSPAPLTCDDLLLVHSKQYLKSLESRADVARYLESPLLNFAPVSLDTAILKPFLHASGGTLLAARQALRSGIGINIGGGYHHAKPESGEGFCLYADVPIAIRRLQQEEQIARALVIDVDVHQGNGTIVCLDDDDTTFTFSLHQRGIYPQPREQGDLDVELAAGLDDDAYLRELQHHLPTVFDQADADICFIVGGCDTLQGDPLASLNMTHQGIVRRDQLLVDECIQRKIPVVLTLSGGYSQDAWKAQHLSIRNLLKRQGLDTTTRTTIRMNTAAR